MTAPERYAPSTYSDLCFVGPLGQMEPLPDVAPSGGVQVDVTRIGGMHRALAGGLTVDTYARKRSWTWNYDMLTEKQLPYVEALQWGHIRGPLRLIDPRRYNRLPEEIASCGSTTGVTRNAFLNDNNSATYWSPFGNMPGDLSTLGPRRLLSGGMEWQILTPSPDENFVLARDPRYTDGLWRVPVLPNEVLEATSWNLYPASAQIVMGLTWRNAKGEFLDSSVTELTSGGSSEWIKLTVNASAPDDAVFCAPFLSSQAPYLPTATSIYSAAWQVASPSLTRLIPAGLIEHCDVPEIGGEWRQGGGGPHVVPDVGSMLYSRPGFYGTALTLHES